MKKSKSIAQKSKVNFVKALQVVDTKEETPDGDSEDGSDVEEMAFMTKRIRYLNKKKKMFSERK